MFNPNVNRLNEILPYLSQEDREYFWAVNNQLHKLRDIRYLLYSKAYDAWKRSKRCGSR